MKANPRTAVSIDRLQRGLDSIRCAVCNSPACGSVTGWDNEHSRNFARVSFDCRHADVVMPLAPPRGE